MIEHDTKTLIAALVIVQPTTTKSTVFVILQIFQHNGILLNIFLVLSAWRLDTVQGQESTHFLHRCPDRY